MSIYLGIYPSFKGSSVDIHLVGSGKVREGFIWGHLGEV
jgi:hypothetical protein